MLKITFNHAINNNEVDRSIDGYDEIVLWDIHKKNKKRDNTLTFTT
ncbi:hypothetical protein [Vibrio sp. MA40-2]